MKVATFLHASIKRVDENMCLHVATSIKNTLVWWHWEILGTLSILPRHKPS